ncbi:type II toxin-antitoxin system RelE/ParE family toxin [bacterium]|nr:type II toxin-antitoxin system RelE/ParE family toxin [bacterium]
MSWRVRIDNAAEKKLRRLDAQVLADIKGRIAQLAIDPRPADCKQLRQSLKGAWRIRVGKYRVLYSIDDAQREVVVYDAGLRDRVYKKRR